MEQGDMKADENEGKSPNNEGGRPRPSLPQLSAAVTTATTTSSAAPSVNRTVSLSRRAGSASVTAKEIAGRGSTTMSTTMGTRTNRASSSSRNVDAGKVRKAQQGRRITIARGTTLSGGTLESQLAESNMVKVVVDGDDGGVDMRQVHERVEAALHTRVRYKKEKDKLAPELLGRLPQRVGISHVNGVFQLSEHDAKAYYALPAWQQFAEDVQKVRLTIGNTSCIKACSHRLGILQERSRMFFLLNAEIEEKHHLGKAGGVFANVAKVDVLVRLAKFADAQQVLDFVVDSCHRTPDAAVRQRDGTTTTLRELLQSHGVSDPKQLTVEGLGWQPLANGEFAEPLGDDNALSDELSYVFFNVRGDMNGQLLRRFLERSGRPTRSPQAAEYGIPVYGSYANEVVDIANALHRNSVGPYKHVRWFLHLHLIQPPPTGSTVDCKTVQDQLSCIFLPMLKTTIAPSATKNVAMAWFMRQLGGFQLENVTDGPEADFDPGTAPPESTPYTQRQSVLYYAYYVFANMTVLNSLRKRKGLNTFQFRQSGGHRTGMDDLLSGYLLGDVITRCTKLLHYPVLQYLCGLHNVGLALSPLGDHMQGVVPYQNHPLPNFLHRCLRIAIATESPLQFHHNTYPLTEEYATAEKAFRLSALDITELARNSVTMSSFPETTKEDWLGERYALGVAGNEFEKSQVTNVRLAFREESWRLERNMLRDLYLNHVHEHGAGLSRWHYLSNQMEVEYTNTMDSRIRFPRTVLSGSSRETKASAAATPRIARALDMRHKYIWKPPKPWETARRRDVEVDFQRKTDTFNEDEWTYAASDAVFIAYPRNAVRAWPRSLPTLDDFHADLRELITICASAEVKEYAHRRLETLDHKYRLHLALNHANEAGTTEERLSSNRDFYQATKVDTHIHMAAGMTPKQILHFVLKKLRDNADDIAMKKGEEIVTLGQLFTKAGITTNLTVDQLNVQADHTLFERFDNFNNKYNPMENGDLRSLLLKTDNYMNGRYFAELVQDVFAQYSRDRYTYAENRLSVYGINIKEWDKLASWFTTHGTSNKHNKWIVQVPRVYKVFRGQNVIGSFGQYLQNIFQPLWEASLHPSEHPTLHNFLNHVSGFDSVDNEATLDLAFSPISPWAWTAVENPPYNYYLYFLYANIRTLNEFRASRGFTTFSLRPHCGESGSDEHLYGAFLCANSICHGINLRNDPPMQYLYYLTQIGLHVSPLSNNALFLHYLNNPFPDFFRRGLNVSLSTDDPMMFHQTQEPLIEEYSVAARVWDLSPNDLCEIARNSVRQCGFDYDFKREAIGDRWYMSSSLGNDPLRTHLSDIRVAFRFETYHTELYQLELSANRTITPFMMTAQEELEINEQNLDVGQEDVLLSTHDQAMEVMLRDIEAKREQLRVSRTHIDAMRRQQHSLVENITEVGLKRQELLEQQRRERDAQKLTYNREAPLATSADAAVGFETVERQTVDRLLRWRPMPSTVLPSVRESTVSAVASRGRPLPPS